eukprot:Seg3978.1 transcript_id=Seg3978.1/GoldUCD/mRNA.D3Y31 product="52 kDa repressor of the inhibitor of the protein kinase" protein_id=Seg3978.1/GoldUCD/D3Y31
METENSSNISTLEVPAPPALHSNDASSFAEPNQSNFPYDIGNFVNVEIPLTPLQKYDLLCKVWRPEPGYKFPRNKTARRFQYQWLERFPWLVYSEVLDGAFCIHCLLFGGESTHNASKLQKLFKSPLVAWSSALQKFSDHAVNSQVHRTATILSSEFKRYMDQSSTPIDIQLDTLKNEQVRKNREKLRPIVDAVILCGRQNIPLRGHRDDARHVMDPKVNPGNFHEILKYGARCANVAVDEYLKSTPRNATYRSKTTQNQLITICGELITEKIISEIKDAKFFSVLADEATDCANIEQMSLVLRYVDKTPSVREEFLGFVPCKNGLSGEAIAENIMQSVEERGLSMGLCRGQGYDGAGNMAGRVNGAAARIQSVHQKAIYVHCSSHQQIVRNMMDQVRVTSDFFNNSQKRFDLLSKIIKEMLPEKNHTHLIDVCRTRWVARLDGLGVFIELYPAIVASIEVIKDNAERTWNDDSCRNASGIFHCIVAFQFIVCLVIVSRCLEVSRPLTKQLQTASYDAGAARSKVSFLFTVLQNMRLEIDAKHDAWYNEAISLAAPVGTLPSKPRTTGRQVHRENVPAESPSQYYRRAITIPFLDHLIGQIKSRFSEKNLDVMDALYGMPNNVVAVSDWMLRFNRFLEIYKDDLPEPRYLATELEMWKLRCHQIEGTPPATLQDLLPFIDELSFPNILTAFRIFGTVPVTTCTCERSISTLRRLKTYLRNSMSASRLNGLALLNVHREINLDIDYVINRFATKHPRRMALADILNSD